MKHELKIWPKYYCRVADGSKTFEVRKNDRGFQPGDIVILKEWDPTPIIKPGAPNEFTFLHSPCPLTHYEEAGHTKSPELYRTVGYVFQLDAERVVFSLLPYTPTNEKD